jgi:hypothetical protein
MKAYTVSEFKNHFRKDGVGHIVVGGDKDISFDDVICDICNAEIKQPKDEPDKKVVHIDGSYALCEICSKRDDRKDMMQRTDGMIRNLNKNFSNRDPVFLQIVEDAVYDDIFDGLKNGVYRFQDKDMTFDKYKVLSKDEKDKYPVATADGAPPTGAIEVIKKMESGKIGSALFKDINVDENGQIKIELTDFGARFHKISKTYDFDFPEFLNSHLKRGLDKEMFNIVFLEYNIEQGNRRL